MSAPVPLPDGTRVTAKRMGPLPGQTSMPGVKAGTPGIVRHLSPSGISLAPGFWMELEDPIVWSHVEQQPPYGYWSSIHQVDVVEDAPLVVQKFGVPDFRSAEQRATDDATAPLDAKIAQLVGPVIDQALFADLPADPAAIRCPRCGEDPTTTDETSDFVPEERRLCEPPPGRTVIPSIRVERWLKFLPNGDRRDVNVPVGLDGTVTLVAEELTDLLVDAGYQRHDADPVETAWQKRREWARSRLQDALNRRGR